MISDNELQTYVVIVFCELRPYSAVSRIRDKPRHHGNSSVCCDPRPSRVVASFETVPFLLDKVLELREMAKIGWTEADWLDVTELFAEQAEKDRLVVLSLLEVVKDETEPSFNFVVLDETRTHKEVPPSATSPHG